MEASVNSRSFHLKSVIVTGMGVFSDSYNLYAISLVYYSALLYLNLNTIQASLVTASSFFGAAFGAILFGVIADRIGRKPMYGIDLMLIFFGAIMQLFAGSFTLLFASRIILGFGIGGDYVMSPVIMAENSDTANRGKLMAVSFSVMFLMGATLSAFVDQVSMLLLVPSISWKVVLAFGAVPSLFVIYYRRKIPETPRFTARIMGQDTSGLNIVGDPGLTGRLGPDRVPYRERLLRSLPIVLAGSLLWVLYDTYSSTFTIYGPITIASNLGLTPVMFTYAAVFIAGLPGTLLSVYLIDRVGRKKLVVAGYAGVFAALLLYAILLSSPSFYGLGRGSIANGSLIGYAAFLGFSFYLLNYLFSAAGPATVIGGTIIVPELVATKVRASGQAINVFIDKMAAALAISSFPAFLTQFGLAAVIGFYAAIAAGSSVIMHFAIPETRDRLLEEISGEIAEAQ